MILILYTAYLISNIVVVFTIKGSYIAMKLKITTFSVISKIIINYPISTVKHSDKDKSPVSFSMVPVTSSDESSTYGEFDCQIGKGSLDECLREVKLDEKRGICR